MKIMGIDISSSSTGWAVIEGDSLVEYGKVEPHKKLSLAQKLCLFGTEINKLVLKHKPDEIAIEDVIQVSSVSVTKILSRFNGIAIAESYKYLQKDPPLYTPPEWKKTLDGCNGGSKKAEIQLSMCKKYSLLSVDRVKYYQDKIEKAKAIAGDCDEESVKDQKKLLKQLTKEFKKCEIQEKAQTIKDQINKIKLQKGATAKANKQLSKDEMFKISMEIYSETSVCDDAADAMGVAICLQKSLK
jgi:Holliday junction resolvasome RuvABC endonuclease subunit